MIRIRDLAGVVTLSLLAAAAPSLAQQTETSTPATAPSTETAPTPPAPSPDIQSKPALPEGSEPGDTHVRIVRLSEVRGTVAMDRGLGRGAEVAIQNMPIAQKMALATGKDSFAEVEFEDGSSMRLAPNSEVRFSLLVLRSTGAKASTVAVDRGTVYVSLEKRSRTSSRWAWARRASPSLPARTCAST